MTAQRRRVPKRDPTGRMPQVSKHLELPFTKDVAELTSPNPRCIKPFTESVSELETGGRGVQGGLTAEKGTRRETGGRSANLQSSREVEEISQHMWSCPVHGLPSAERTGGRHRKTYRNGAAESEQ